eukprot:4068700-Heterocapsa_arctica.AAC.1
MGVKQKAMLERVVEARNWSQAMILHNDQHSARNLMVIARTSEDRSNTFSNYQTPSKTLKAMYTSMCTPVGPTE